MAKQDFQKRMGHLYALALQHGMTEQDLMVYVEGAFKFLYSEKKQKENMKKGVGD